VLAKHRSQADKENTSPACSGLGEQLRNFQKKHRPSVELMADVVTMLRANGVAVPGDISLTPPAFVETTMAFGSYLHFGVEQNLRNLLRFPNQRFQQMNILLDFGFFFHAPLSDDGQKLPQFLIILGRPNMKPFNVPFVIGAYRGKFPELSVANEILQPLVDELKAIGEQPLIIHSRLVQLELGAFVCDPVANSLITCTSLPDSQFGCSKCTADLFAPPGHDTTETYRLDTDFQDATNSSVHHIQEPILRRLNVGLISQFAIDYKHTVCLGVMRSLWRLWTQGKLDYRLNKAALRSMAGELRMAGDYTPQEFRRRMPNIDETDNWDAYDWRQFLLYYAPILCRDKLPPMYFQNFVILSTAFSFMLVSPRAEHETLDLLAGRLLKVFLLQFTELYGADLLDYNFHNLAHIEQMTRALGPLESIGGFLFDQQLDVVVDFARQPDAKLELLGHSIVENTKQLFENTGNEVTMSNEGLQLKKFGLCNTQADDCFMTTEGRICTFEKAVRDSAGEIVIMGREFGGVASFCEMPWEQLTCHRICRVFDLALETKAFRIEDVRTKMVKVKTSDGLFVIPFCNF
jgi:hypothetical protein